MNEEFCIEFNGDCWQSVVPSNCTFKGQLHLDLDDALDYFAENGVNVCNVNIFE